MFPVVGLLAIQLAWMKSRGDSLGEVPALASQDGRPKPVLVTWSSDFSYPQVERICAMYVNRGHRTIFAGCDRNRSHARSETIDEVHCEYLVRGRGYHSMVATLAIVPWMIRLFWYALRADVAFIHVIDFDSALPVALACRLRGVLFVYHVLDNFELRYRWPVVIKGLICSLDRMIARWASAIIVLDENRIVGAIASQKEKITVIHVCPPDYGLPRYPDPEQPFTIYAMGFLGRRRGIGLLLDAATALPDIRFLLAGNFLERDLAEKAQSLSNVRYVGYVRWSEATELGWESDIVFAFFDPIYEINVRAGAQKWYEAMMIGRPILGNREIMKAQWIESERIGFSCPYDAAALQSKIVELANNRQECRLRGARGGGGLKKNLIGRVWRAGCMRPYNAPCRRWRVPRCTIRSPAFQPEQMQALVTGGAGFIGSNLTRQLLAGCHSVTILDNLQSGYRVNIEALSRARFIEGDVRNELAVMECARDADCIFHLAASVGNKRSIDMPLDDAQTNVLGTLNVLEAARKLGIRKVVFSSSAGIFGELKTLPIREDHPVEPDSPYGASKLGAEKAGLAYAKLHGVEFVSLRYFNVYGPNQRLDPYGNVIPIFVFRMLRGEPLTIFGDGEQTRDFVNVDDVVEANIRSALAPGVWGAFNIGSGTRISINDLVKKLAALSGLQPEVQHGPPRPGDVRDSLADIEAARRAFGFEPSHDMDAKLTEYINWARGELARAAVAAEPALTAHGKGVGGDCRELN